MQIAPIRPYNMSQKHNQQNTNFKGVVLKLNKNTPELLQRVERFKTPAEVEVFKNKLLSIIKGMETRFNDKILTQTLYENLTKYSQREGVIDPTTFDYEKTLKEVWPNDTVINVEIRSEARKVREKSYTGDEEVFYGVNDVDTSTYRTVITDKLIFKTPDEKEHLMFQKNYYESIPEYFLAHAIDDFHFDIKCSTLADEMLKKQPGLQKLRCELNKKMKSKNIQKDEEVARRKEINRKAWLGDTDTNVVPQKISVKSSEKAPEYNSLLDLLTPEQICELR